MSEIWKFSSSSEHLVKQCISAGSLRDINNKWVRKFLQKEIHDTNLSTMNIDITSSEPNQVSLTSNSQKTTKSDPSSGVFDEDFIANIESDPILQIKTMNEECYKNTNIFTTLAQRLSVTAFENICKYVLNAKDMDIAFTEKFILNFFPEYLKRDNSHFTLDFVFQIFKEYPSQFKTLLTVILKDPGIPSSFIQSLVQSLSEEEKSEFLTYLMEIPLSNEEFVLHLSAICLAYKDCSKSEILQRYILQSLKEYSAHCVMNKNYGKLLLIFLQAHETYEYQLDLELTNKIIEIHRSAFKRPCMTIYVNLVNERNSDN